MAVIEKIAVIGGGSTYTPELVDGFIVHRDKVQVEEIALHDIDAERLEVVGGLVERMVRHAGLSTRITRTKERAAALQGVAFVISQIRVGGMEARIRDEKIPLAHGVVGQETTGPGGTLKAWRTIPVVLDIARDVEQLAPDAWIINFTNPSGIITETLLKHTSLKAVGLCNNPINFTRLIAGLFGVPDEAVFLEWVGLNHVNWIRRVYVQGRDVSADLMAQVRAGLPFYPFDADLVEALDVFPTWYLQHYYYPDRKVAEIRAAGKTRGEVVMEVERDLLRKYADPSLIVKPPELSQRGGALYSEAAVRLILSLALDRRDVQIVDVRNGGAIPDLPADGVVEVPCVVGAHGITPLQMGPLPETVRPLCQMVKAWETWTVEAGVTGSRSAALTAMVTNPLVRSIDLARTLLEEMLEANREHLPQFFPARRG